jgi:hypothetical protein
MYSCSGSECKKLLASLGWREVTQALDNPAIISNAREIPLTPAAAPR